METLTLLGVDFERKTVAEYEKALLALLENGRGALVVTPNPEMLVESVEDARLLEALRRADIRLVDGVGLVFASVGRLHRFPGVEALAFLARTAHDRGLRVLLAGGLHEGDAEKAGKALGVEGYAPGRIEKTEDGWVGDEGLKKKISEVQPDVLALALGHGKQELWLADHLKEFPSVRLGIGVGGALEFFASRQKRAPRWLRSLGLEWLWRLIHEPKRWRRITSATLIFPLLVLREKFRHTR